MPDKKITAMDANTDPQPTDLLTIVDDPSGTSPNNEKIELGELLITYNKTAAETSAGVTINDYRIEPGNVLRYNISGYPTNDNTEMQRILDTLLPRIYVPASIQVGFTFLELNDGQFIEGDGIADGTGLKLIDGIDFWTAGPGASGSYGLSCKTGIAVCGARNLLIDSNNTACAEYATNYSELWNGTQAVQGRIRQSGFAFSELDRPAWVAPDMLILENIRAINNVRNGVIALLGANRSTPGTLQAHNITVENSHVDHAFYCDSSDVSQVTNLHCKGYYHGSVIALSGLQLTNFVYDEIARNPINDTTNGYDYEGTTVIHDRADITGSQIKNVVINGALNLLDGSAVNKRRIFNLATEMGSIHGVRIIDTSAADHDISIVQITAVCRGYSISDVKYDDAPESLVVLFHDKDAEGLALSGFSMRDTAIRYRTGAVSKPAIAAIDLNGTQATGCLIDGLFLTTVDFTEQGAGYLLDISSSGSVKGFRMSNVYAPYTDNGTAAWALDLATATYTGLSMRNIHTRNAKPSGNSLLYAHDINNCWFADSAVPFGKVFYPRTAGEVTASVTPVNYEYEPGVILRYGTNTTPGTTDMTTAIQAAVDSIEADGGGILFFPQGTYKITAAITINETMIISGVGSGAGDSVIDNTSAAHNVGAFIVQGAGTGEASRDDYVVIRDLAIKHEATSSTKYAIQFDNAAYSRIWNVRIDCNSSGYGGVLYGDELATPVSQAFASAASHLRIDNHVNYGIRVNSTGTQWNFYDCYVRSTVNGATGAYFNKEMCFILGGQWGANNTGGIPIFFYNTGAAEIEGGGVKGVTFENVASAEYGVVIDGDTRAWRNVVIDQVAANLSSVLGHVVHFKDCSDCTLLNPIISNPASAGSLANFSSESTTNEIICDYDAAQGGVTVHASATRSVMKVTTRVARSNVTNISTAANFTVILDGGVDQVPPGFVPMYTLGAWNYWLVSLADNVASSLTLPAVGAALVRAKVEILHDGAANFMGSAIVDADSGGAAITAQYAGADFNVTTGTLAGTTGTDVKVTLSAHTDGKIYLENRSGATRLFTAIITSVVYQ